MYRATLLGLLLLPMTWCLTVRADEPPAKEKAAAAVSTLDALKAAPNDVQAWRKYLSEQFSQLFPLIDKSPDEAEKKLAEIRSAIAGIEPDQPAAKTQARIANTTLDNYGEMIAVARSSLSDLEKQLQAQPDDEKLIRRFTVKASRQIGSMARTEPDKAETLLREVETTFNAARDAATTEGAKKAYELQARAFSSLHRSIESGKKLVALIGKDAAPLKVETWLNGSRLTDADLKGKVVLLDFWAIWCGPCIATFPHLREWNEKYEKKGLVMIGLTNYYGYDWDDATSRPKRIDPKEREVTHEQEHEMLKKFAAHHQLKHRFAIQTDRSASEFYAVTGIPHVVVIDQQGKVRLMRIGSGEANAKDIAELLEKLLGGEKVAGK